MSETLGNEDFSGVTDAKTVLRFAHGSMKNEKTFQWLALPSSSGVLLVAQAMDTLCFNPSLTRELLEICLLVLRFLVTIVRT